MPGKPKILVTSAGGNTGIHVALRLREQGFPVRAVVRRDDARAQRLRASGAEVALADIYSTADMRRVMAGVQRAYHCAPTAPNGLHFGAVFAAAAREARLEHVVMLSQWLSSPDHPSIFTRHVWLMEEMLKALPETTLTVVNPGWFAANYFMVMGLAAQLGVLPMPLGDGDVKKNAPPSNEAIAAVAAGCLADPDKHAGQTYRPTGPELLSPNEIATAMGKALGRRVKYSAISEKMFLKALVANPPGNFSWQAITQLALYAEEYRRGTFAIGAPTDTVQTVGGLEPETFQMTAARAAEVQPETQRRLSNRTAAMWGFLKTGFTPAPNLDRIIRDRDLPVLESSVMAYESDDWARIHDPKKKISAVA